MPGITIREGEGFERALKRFTKVIEKEGVLSEVKKNQFYEKPSERKKRKLNAAKRKAMLRARAKTRRPGQAKARTKPKRR